jgi:hypothetical protein
MFLKNNYQRWTLAWGQMDGMRLCNRLAKGIAFGCGTSGQGNITGSNSRLPLDFDARRKPRNRLGTSIRKAAAWSPVSRLPSWRHRRLTLAITCA